MATKIIAYPIGSGEPIIFNTIKSAMEKFGFRNDYKFKKAMDEGRAVYVPPGEKDGGRAFCLDEALD